MARLVFVHGIGGARDAGEELRKWSSALAEGVGRAGHPEVAALLASSDSEIKPAFAYYGDLFSADQAQGVGDGPLTDDAQALLAEILDEIIESRLVSTSDDAERRTLAHARAELHPSGEPQGPGKAVRHTLNVATTLLSIPGVRRAGEWASGRIMIGQLGQVARYLGRGEPDAEGVPLDRRIRGRVAAELDADTQVVIAHSLGSVVALEALQEHRGAVPLLITIGSPLAMRTVVLPRLRVQPPACPEAVGEWLNFWNDEDIFTGRPRLEKDFLPNERGVRPASTPVVATGLWTHTATKYLEKADVGGPAARTITARTSKAPTIAARDLPGGP